MLDVGLGNGKIGFIARDLLDVMHSDRGRYKREDWKTKIDGIEIFPEYIQDHQKAIYDEIFIGNALDVIDTLGYYDMIILGDVLEHFEKGQAWQFLDKCVEHSNKHLILCLPLGKKWTQEAIYGNPYERHLSFWSFEEFKPFAFKYSIFKYAPGNYGAFLIKKEDYIEYKVKEIGTSELNLKVIPIRHPSKPDDSDSQTRFQGGLVESKKEAKRLFAYLNSGEYPSSCRSFRHAGDLQKWVAHGTKKI